MRLKDQAKEKRILTAARDLVNEVGFKSASMSKIAKTAEVSPATIYLYFPNQEALFIEIYYQAKHVMADALFAKTELNSMTIRDATEHLWRGYVRFMQKHSDYHCYFSHFSASPYIAQVDCSNVDPRFEQLFALVKRGAKEGIFRDMDWPLYWAALIGPIEKIFHDAQAYQIKITPQLLKTVFSMAWKSITC